MGLKALSLDHGLPRIGGYDVWFCSDEHITLRPSPRELPDVGDLVRVVPSHVDPTVVLHDRMLLVDEEGVTDEWLVDMRGWQ